MSTVEQFLREIIRGLEFRANLVRSAPMPRDRDDLLRDVERVTAEMRGALAFMSDADKARQLGAGTLKAEAALACQTEDAL